MAGRLCSPSQLRSECWTWLNFQDRNVRVPPMRTAAAAMTQHCRAAAAAAVRGVNLGRSTHFCVHARCFLRNDMKTRWFTVDKDNLEPCLLIQNAKHSILKPSLSAPPSTLFMICCLELALTFMSPMSSILWFLLGVHWPTLFLSTVYLGILFCLFPKSQTSKQICLAPKWYFVTKIVLTYCEKKLF